MPVFENWEAVAGSVEEAAVSHAAESFEESMSLGGGCGGGGGRRKPRVDSMEIEDDLVSW